MSTAVNQKPLTIAQRTTKAAEDAATLLRLENSKVVGAVLAEVATEELRRNSAFAERVRLAYNEATAKKAPTRQTRPPAPKKTKAKLTPLKGMETHQINIAAAVDPYYLNRVFGADQLPLALEEFSKPKLLEEAVPLVQKKHPSASISRSAKKDAVIAFIVQHVRGEP